MANVLGDILKDAGNIAGGAINELGEFGRRYRYGPYYKEEQEMRAQQYETQQEAQRARKEYYEYLKKAAEAKAQNNPQQQQKLNDIVGAVEVLEAMKRNPAYKDNPDMLSKINTGMDNMLRYMNSMVGGTNKPVTPQPKAGMNMNTVPDAVITGNRYGNPERLSKFFANPPLAVSGFQQPQNQGGALSDIVGPPEPPDWNPYTPSGPQAKWASTPPEKRGALLFGTDTGRAMPETAKSTNEIDFYMPKLDRTSQNELQQILATGNQVLINKAIQRLRDKYGTMQ